MSDTTPEAQIITLVYYHADRRLNFDIGSTPVPLAQKLLEMAADELADVSPIDIIAASIAGEEYERSLVGGEDEDEE